MVSSSILNRDSCMSPSSPDEILQVFVIVPWYTQNAKDFSGELRGALELLLVWQKIVSTYNLNDSVWYLPTKLSVNLEIWVEMQQELISS